MRFRFFILTAFLLSACEDRVTLTFDRLDKRLVVEGLITDANGPYYINLSYPAKYTYTPDSAGSKFRRVTGATVTVADDLGNTYSFAELESTPGLYASDAAEFKGTVGRSYTLRITDAEGKAYTSRPEKLTSVTPIDSIYYEKENQDYKIFIDTHDSPGLGQYYQWRIFFDNRMNDWIDISTDEYFDGNEVKRFQKDEGPFVPGLTIRIEQLSISREKYRFLFLVDQQTTNGGTPFDSPASPIIGNVYNVNDSTDYALGYFGASAVSSKATTIK